MPSRMEFRCPRCSHVVLLRHWTCEECGALTTRARVQIVVWLVGGVLIVLAWLKYFDIVSNIGASA